MIHTPAQVRRAARALAIPGVVATALVIVTTATPAYAEAPEQWEGSDPVAPLHALLVLAGIPLGIFVVIALLVYLPSMIRGERYEPGLAWREDPEWFGGPRGGLESKGNKGDQAIEAGDRGGASAHW